MVIIGVKIFFPISSKWKTDRRLIRKLYIVRDMIQPISWWLILRRINMCD